MKRRARRRVDTVQEVVCPGSCGTFGKVAASPVHGIIFCTVEDQNQNAKIINQIAPVVVEYSKNVQRRVMLAFASQMIHVTMSIGMDLPAAHRQTRVFFPQLVVPQALPKPFVQFFWSYHL